MKSWNSITRHLVLTASFLLFGCDEATVITHVDKRPNVSVNDLWSGQGPNGIAVEIHGTPFQGIGAEQLTEVLRPPAAAAQVKFYNREVGGRDTEHSWRLVLHFNPVGAPNSQADCRAVIPMQTGPSLTEGYTVNASFCQGADWMAHGYMHALKTEAGDIQAYAQQMQALFVDIFREAPDR